MKTVILANGTFPTHHKPLEALFSAENLVICDGAYSHLEALKRRDIPPFYVVGDGDSLAPEVREMLGERYIHFPDQETNDMTKAVRFCVARGWKDLVILGATGLREDHTLGNISLLEDYMREYGCDVQMITDFGTFSPVKGEASFASFRGQQVSVFALSAHPKVTSEGLQYPIDKCLTRLWEGTLNASLGERFTIKSQSPVLVYQTHEPKQ